MLPLSRLAIPSLVAFALSTGCGGDGDESEESEATGSEDGGPPANVEYWADIKPLVDAKCNSCHDDGGIAPFPLTSYEAMTDFMPAASMAIHTGAMPPWPPSADCNSYLGDRSLTQDQIDLFDRWSDLGMPEGDPADEGPALADEMPTLSRVDATLPMPVEYSPRSSPDDYRCFLVDWPAEYTDTAYVTGFAALPGNAAIVHHVIAFLAGPDDVAAYRALDDADDGPGYTCFGGSGGPSRGWLGGWAPGSRGSDLPAGVGLEVQPGSVVILQLHYNTLTADPQTDLTAIQVKIDNEVERVARVLPFANPQWFTPWGMMIPAGQPDVSHSFSADPLIFMGAQNMTIFSTALHMHLLGTNARMSIERGDGSETCMLDIEDWDFSWQGSYGHQSPIELARGDRIRLDCTYDNTPDNQPYVDGERIDPRDVGWGEGTTDEMCLGVMLVATD